MVSLPHSIIVSTSTSAAVFDIAQIVLFSFRRTEQEIRSGLEAFQRQVFNVDGVHSALPIRAYAGGPNNSALRCHRTAR